MRVFKNRPFARFARKSGIRSADRCKAIGEAERGLIAADLGGEIIKQRIAREGAGKSGGYRTLILFKRAEVAIFVHGFAKNDADKIQPDELKALKKLAAHLLALPVSELSRLAQDGTLTEVKCHGDSEKIS